MIIQPATFNHDIFWLVSMMQRHLKRACECNIINYIKFYLLQYYILLRMQLNKSNRLTLQQYTFVLQQVALFLDSLYNLFPTDPPTIIHFPANF